MSSHSSNHPPVLIEEIIAVKQSLGAEYRFEPSTLEIKPNKLGVNGIFARRALSKGTKVLSVPRINSRLNVLRAYEEAQELLQKLGPERYELHYRFILACAMYLRCMSKETKDVDILVTGSDLQSSYAGSPTTAFLSKELVLLMNPNNKFELDAAVRRDQMIEKLGVDRELFRAMLGYVSSRSFKDHGIFPVFDWFNSSYKHGTNCNFFSYHDQLCFVTIRDVEEGEELLWCYNDGDALATWFSYGYRDYERPTLTFLEVNLSKKEKAVVENYIDKKIAWLDKSTVFPPQRIDENKFVFTLMGVGQPPTPELVRSSIMECLTRFSAVRTFCRIFVWSAEQEYEGDISGAELHGENFVFGLDVELKVIAFMHTALKNGLVAVRQRVEAFKVTDVGRSINMTDYVKMIEEADQSWAEALDVIGAICSAESINDCIAVINSALKLDIKSEDEIEPTIAKVSIEHPTLVGALIWKYMLGRLEG